MNIVSDQTNGLGVGTYILLLKKITVDLTSTRHGAVEIAAGYLKANCFETIYESTLVSGAQAVTISGLDGNSDILYEIEIFYVMGNGAGGNPIFLQPNNDASNTGFETLQGYGASTFANQYPSSQSGVAYGATNGDIAYAKVLFYAKSGYPRTWVTRAGNCIASTTVDDIIISGVSWTDTSNNVTSIVLGGATAGMIGVGSFIRLKALKHST